MKSWKKPFIYALCGSLELNKWSFCIKNHLYLLERKSFLWTDWPDSHHPLILFFTFHLSSSQHAFIIIFVACFPGKVRAKVLLSHWNRSRRNGVHVCHKGSKKDMEAAEGMKQLVQNSSFSKWVSLFNLNDSMAVPLNAWNQERRRGECSF